MLCIDFVSIYGIIMSRGERMKKKIIIGVFCILILATVIFSIVGAIQSYNYDIENNVDVLEGFGVVLTLMVGGFFVFYELDLFYTVYYFFAKPKTIAKSTLNILSNLSLIMIVASYFLNDFFRVAGIYKLVEDWMIPIFLFFIYVILRITYFIVSTNSLNKRDSEIS